MTVAHDPPRGTVDRLADLAVSWRAAASSLLERASGLAERAEGLRDDSIPAPFGENTVADREAVALVIDKQVRAQRDAAGVYRRCAEALEDAVSGARWRDLTHSGPPAGHDQRMDTSTLSSRLRALADFLDSASIEVSWLYLDPTPDGPGEAATVHTLEMDGSYAGQVLGNLVSLIGSFSRLDSIRAEASQNRVVIEAYGGTPQDQAIRGTAVILEPYATPLQATLDLSLAADFAATSRGDLTYAQIQQLASDPQMAQQTTQPEPPAVDVPPAPADPGGDPSSTPTDTPPPSPTDSGSVPATDPSSSGPVSVDPAAPATGGDPSPTPSPTTEPPSSDSSTSPAQPSTPDSSVPVEQPQAPSTDSPAPTGGATSEATGGTTTDTPASGDGGLVVRGSSDAPSQPQPSPSPDPTSTAVDGTPGPVPVATGQQPGTPDGASVNADGSPVEPTAGTTADVGQPSAPTSPSVDPTSDGSALPGQTPISVSDAPVPSGGSGEVPADTAGSGSASAPSTGDTSADEIAALEARLAELRAAGQGGQVTTGDASGVQVATNVDPVPDGGQNLATGQGGGTTSAAPDSGDGSATGSAGTGPTVTTGETTAAADTANPDGF